MRAGGAKRILSVMLLLLLASTAPPDLSASVREEVARGECRAPAGGQDIEVCGRREERRRYQVTDPAAPYDPDGEVKGVMTERMGWIGEGDSGIGSCGPVGPSSGTGCFVRAWRRTLQQRGWLVR